MLTTSDKIRPDGQRLILGCQCGACTLPFAYVQNGILMIQSEHYGKAHINVISLEDVRQMIEDARQSIT